MHGQDRQPRNSCRFEDDGIVQYRGKNNDDGHFELFSAEVDGVATLHKLPHKMALEGSWIEGADRGMWVISLRE